MLWKNLITPEAKLPIGIAHQSFTVAAVREVQLILNPSAHTPLFDNLTSGL
jgi:hypothetical protein